MAPLTVDELQQHPEYNHTIWHLKPTKEGKVPVAKDRGGPINLAYEVHGSGDRHLVVSCSIFGLCKLQHPTSRTGTHRSSICHTQTLRIPAWLLHTLCSSALQARFVSVAWTVSQPLLTSHVPESTKLIISTFLHNPIMSECLRTLLATLTSHDACLISSRYCADAM
jgi:hypothetical protein